MYSVMIVDDDATSLSITKALLEDEYDVQIMRSGLQALGYLKDYNDIDIILLDMMMPGTDGIKVLKELKEDENLRDIPVIFLTSLDGMNFEAEALTSGASDFLSKPVHQGLMKLKIQRHLYIAQLKRENRIMKQRLKVIGKVLEDLDLE